VSFDYSTFFVVGEAFQRRALRVNVVEPADVDPWAVTHPASWDGSDLFCPDGTAHVVVTEAVTKAVTAVGATNIRFANITEWEMVRI